MVDGNNYQVFVIVVSKMLTESNPVATPDETTSRVHNILELYIANMRSFLAVAALLSFLLSYVSATALTYRMVPNEKSCFYAWVEEKGVKMAFYFAVRLYQICPPSAVLSPLAL